MNEREDRRRHTRCSFCGKDQSQVRKLVAGPGVYICDQCIDLCQEVLEEDTKTTSQKRTKGGLIPNPKTINAALDQYVIGCWSARPAAARRCWRRRWPRSSTSPSRLPTRPR